MSLNDYLLVKHQLINLLYKMSPLADQAIINSIYTKYIGTPTIFSYDQPFKHDVYNECIRLGHRDNRTMVYNDKIYVFCNKCKLIFSIHNTSTLIFKPRFVNANAKLVLYDNVLCFTHEENKVQIIKSIHNLPISTMSYYKFVVNSKNNQHIIIHFTPNAIVYYIKWPLDFESLIAKCICDMFAIFTYRTTDLDSYVIIYKLSDLQHNEINNYYMKIQISGFRGAKCKVNNNILYIVTGGEMIHIEISTKLVLRHINRYDCVFMYHVIDFDFKPNGDIVFVYDFYPYVTLLEHNVNLYKKYMAYNLLYELQLFTNEPDTAANIAYRLASKEKILAHINRQR